MTKKVSTEDRMKPTKFSLLSVLVVVASCLSGALAGEMRMDQSRASYRQAFEMQKERETPVVGQESSYGGYYVPEEPFSSTENYQKTNAFIVGLQLADTYEYSDDCFNSVVEAIDQRAYFANNRTIHN